MAIPILSVLAASASAKEIAVCLRMCEENRKRTGVETCETKSKEKRSIQNRERDNETEDKTWEFMCWTGERETTRWVTCWCCMQAQLMMLLLSLSSFTYPYPYLPPATPHSSRTSYGLDFRWQFQFHFDCSWQLSWPDFLSQISSTIALELSNTMCGCWGQRGVPWDMGFQLTLP